MLGHLTYFSHLPVRRKRWMIVILATVFNVALILWLIVVQAQNQRADDTAKHSREVLSAARALLWELVNAETGMRGYMISSNPEFLEPYNAAVRTAPQTLTRLKTLCAGDPEMLLAIKQLEIAVPDLLSYHATNKRRMEEGHFDQAREATRQGEGKRRMDRTRALVQSVEDLQKIKDADAQAAYLRLRRAMEWMLRGGLCAGVLLSLTFHWILGDITDRIEAVANNNRLGSEGAAPGNAVSGHDEIAALDAQFRKLWSDKDLETRRSLENYAMELERSNRDLQDFASVASHDLQEPLRKIIAFGTRLETHLEGRLDEKASDYLTRIRKAAERMSSLNESLLELSRVRSRARALETVELDDVLAGVLSDLEERIECTDAKVRIGRMPAVIGDPNQMRQLFQNLLSNALKFRVVDREPLIEVSAQHEPSGKQWRIVVQDNGLGFEQRFAEQIFRPFQRLHGRSEFEGNGIGLTIVEKIVARHGGLISVQSEPGCGARFTILLPQGKGEMHDESNASATAIAG